MNSLKKILSILLVCVFVCAVFAGCSKNKEKNTGSGEKQTLEKRTNEYGEIEFNGMNTEDLDFEGEEISVLIRDTVTSSREWYKESPQDDLDYAIQTRNAVVEDTLNVKFKPLFVQDAYYDTFVPEFNNRIKQDIDGDRSQIDIAANWAYGAAWAEMRDYTSNLNDKELFPYFDFSKPCWNQAIVNNTTVNGRLHYIAGDINLSMFDSAMVIWFNKTLYDANKMEGDPENIQEHAIEGKWTYDDLYTWANRLYVDSNGTAGRQENDTYGFAMEDGSGCPNPHDAIPYAWDLGLIKTESDGTHSVNIVANSKAEDALIKFRNLINQEGTWANFGTLPKTFAQGKYVFMAEKIYRDEESNLAIRGMEDKYGLLPWPKYDEEQESYGTTSQDYYTLMTVLNHSGSSKKTAGGAISAFLQLSTEESYTSVRGYYFNRIIKPKYFGTDDSEGTVTNSIKLFDIIIDNIKYDFGTIYSAQLNDIAWLWRDTVGTTSTLEQAYNAKKDAFDKAVASTDAWLGLT